MQIKLKSKTWHEVVLMYTERQTYWPTQTLNQFQCGINFLLSPNYPWKKLPSKLN